MFLLSLFCVLTLACNSPSPLDDMMHPLAALLVTSLVGLSQAIAPPPFDPCKPYCADVFMVACRATLEVAGEGQIGAVAQYVQDNTQQTVERLALGILSRGPMKQCNRILTVSW